jgi:hypothetical protein
MVKSDQHQAIGFADGADNSKPQANCALTEAIHDARRLAWPRFADVCERGMQPG